jgi:hypothetical protein
MMELIFLLPTIICAITITVIGWNQHKKRNETNREWVNRILE